MSAAPEVPRADSDAALLRAMLEIESLSGHEQRLARFLVETMTTLGFDARVDEAGNAVGERAGPPAAPGQPTRHIVLLGHMDTVPGVVPVRIEQGDLLYGRGAVDAKGPLAAFILAAARARLSPGARITVIGAVEEECATSKGARHVADTMPAPQWCIIGEPSAWDGVTLGYKGRMLIDLRIERPLSHTAGPDEPAAEAAVAFWSAVSAHCAAFNEGKAALFDRILPSLRHINTSSDGLAERVDATIGLRLPLNLDLHELEQTIARFGASIAGASVRCYARERAHRAAPDTTLARAFVRAIRAAGARPTLKHKTGTSDMNVVGPAWGCPIVAYGPGDSRLDHTPDEHVSIAEFDRAVAVLIDVLEGF